MQRNKLIPYLTALFSDGNPSGADFKVLIEGLGSQADRPHIVCVSEGSNIPDNQIITSTYAMSSVGMGNSSGCGCGCNGIPAPGSSSSKSERVVNILCDYFRQGWELECVGKCTGSLCARAYYYVLSMDASTNVYEIVSIQFSNPGFDVCSIASCQCIRILRFLYNRNSGCVEKRDSRLVLTDKVPVVQSADIRGIKVVYDEPPKREDGILYIQLELAPLMKPEVMVTGTSQSKIDISWGAVTGALYYEVKLDDMKYDVSGTSFSFVGLDPDTEHTIAVRAMADGRTNSNSGWSYVIAETKDSMILMTPAVRVVSTVASSGVVLEWDAVEGATSYSYRIGCGCSCGALVTGITDTRVVVEGLQPGMQYTLQLKAVSVEVAVLDSDWAAVGFMTR